MMDRRKREVSRVEVFARFVAACSFFSASLFTGCANPGPPRPPSLQLPALVTDLSAERVGDQVTLRWTTPSQSTDSLNMKGAMSAEICRSVGPPAANLKKSFSACAIVKQISVVAGLSSASDDLPTSLLADPVALLAYRIEILNAAGRSAGKSTSAAFAASGAAPPPAAQLTATASESGTLLRWKNSVGGELFGLDIARSDLTGPARTSKENAPSPAAVTTHRSKSHRATGSEAASASEVHLRAISPISLNSQADGLRGTIDTTAKMGQSYSYVVRQVRVASVEGHTLELFSQPSPVVTITMRDTFPPKSPTGLATIPGTMEAAIGKPAAAYVDLSWEPNSESDLAGYFVYRQLARPNGDPQGPLGRLTPLPIAAPAFRDVAVAPGQRYIYFVTAVDASANESAPSAKAQEAAESPNTVGSPH